MDSTPPQTAGRTPVWLALVREKVDHLRFGIVQRVVHEGRVTHIECTEKTRLSAAPTVRE